MDDPRPIRYLALGDSFTIGTGVGAERAWPALLTGAWRQRGRQVALVNPAVNGHATDELIREQLPLAREVRPTLVTLLIGANDVVRAIRGRGAFHGILEDRYGASLERIHDQLRKAGVPAAAVHVLPQPDWSTAPAAAAFAAPDALLTSIERANRIARETTERAGARYVDLFPLMRTQAARAMLAPDGLHPSEEAHVELAEALLERIRTT